MVVDPVDVAGTADDDEMLLSELDDPLRDNFGLKLGRRKIFGRSVVSFLGTGFGTETWVGETILGICCSANLNDPLQSSVSFCLCQIYKMAIMKGYSLI
jgi:hypothetical protein